MLKVDGFDPSDPLSIVCHFSPRFDQSVKNYIPIEIDDRNTCKSLSFLSENSLTVKRQNFSLSKQGYELNNVHLLSTFLALI
jgi:hypothetical protein